MIGRPLHEGARPLVAVAPALVLSAWWAADDGGYFAVKWMPGVLVLLWLLAAVAAVPGLLRRPSPPAAVALAALAGYTAWSLASITWAEAPGPALEGSARTLLYLAAFGTFALLPWNVGALRVALVALVAGISLIAVVSLARAQGLPPPADVVLDGRLIAPLGYQNAAAALWTIAALPALALAVSAGLPGVVRVLLLAACGFLVGLAVLAQSRGWLFTLPVVLVVALALLPRDDRARFVLGCVVVAAAVGPALPALLAPYETGGGRPVETVARPLQEALRDAGAALVLVTVALVVTGALLLQLERRLTARAVGAPGIGVAARRAGTALVAAVLVGGAVAGVVATRGDPVGRVTAAWDDFRDFEGGTVVVGQSRFGDLSSVRYDFWRAGVDAWRDRPWAGLGQDNFANEYARERSTGAVEARWVHSLALRALVHTGVVGAVLLLVFLGAALVAGVRRTGGSTRLVAVAALLPLVVFAGHGAVDWLWEFPALGAPALGLAGAGAALAGTGGALGARARRRVAVGTVALAVAGTALVVPPYLANRDVRAASSSWRAEPGSALRRLGRARDLHPLDARAPLVQGLVAGRLGRIPEARDALEEAVRRDPGAWLPRLLLGLLPDRAGEAERHLRAGVARNPRGRTPALALRRLRQGRPMGFAAGVDSVAREAARQGAGTG